MANKPTYEELEQRVKELENETFEWKQAEKVLKENELKLRVSEQELNSILHHSPDIIYRLNPAGEITYINDIAKEYGYSREDLIGKNILEFVHPDDREKAVHRIDERRTGDRSTKSYEIRLLRKDLDYVPFENKSRGFGDFLIDAEGIYSSGKPGTNTFVGTQGIARDIFERKQAEETVQESEERYRNLFNNAQVGIFRTRISDGKVLECNDRFAQTYGYKTPEDCKDDFVVSEHYADPDIREKMVASLMEKGEVNDIEGCFSRKDGDDVWVRFSARAYPEEGYLEGVGYDITEEKRALEALRESEEHLRSLMESASNFAVYRLISDVDNPNSLSVIFVSPSITDIMGVSKPMRFETWFEHIHPDDVERIVEANIEAFKTLRFDETMRVYHPQKQKWVWIHAISTGFEDQERQRKYVNGILIDVTREKETEKALRESERKRQSWIENSPVCTKIVDLDFNLQFMSASGIRDLKIDNINEFYGKPYPFHFYPDSFNFPMTNNLKKAKETGAIITQEASVLDIEGNKLWYHSTIVPVNDDEGKLNYMLVVSLDTTERKRAEEALRESEEKFRSFAEQSLVGIYLISDGLFKYVNPKFAEMFGYSVDECLDNMHFQQLVHPEDLATVEKQVGRRLSGETKAVRYSFKGIKKSGETIHVEIFGSSMLLKGKIVVTGTMLDITDRKQAEEALRESEEKYRSLITNIPDVTWTTDYEGKTSFISPNIEKEYGYTPEEITKGGDNIWLGRIHPEDAEKVEKAFKELFEEGTMLDVEYRIKRKDGEWIWLYDRSVAIYERDGVMYADGIFTNITNRKQAEEALRESEAFIKAVLDNLPIGIAVNSVDPSVKFEYMNDNFPKCYRTSRAALADPDAFWNAVYEDPEFREAMKNRVLADCASGDSERMYWADVPITRKGAETSHITARNTPVSNKQLMISTVWDVTERKQAEEALRESEEKFRLISEQSLLAIGIIQDGHIIYANEMYSKLTGYSLEEIYGWEPYGYARTVCKDDLPLVMKQSRKKQTGDEDVITNYQFRGFTKSKEIVWWDTHSRTITYHGRPADLFTLIDITEKVESENDRMALQAKLQHAQKMEAIGTLAGGVAHDLNNILGGLVSYPELLLLQLPGDSPLRKSILTIQKSGEKAAAVVQDLLTLARRGVVVTEVVNLNKIIAEYLKSPEHEKLQSYHPGVHIETHLRKDTLNILGSSIHLSKTVMNLVSNAVEAMPEGGNLIVSTENRYIDRPIKGYDDVREGDYVVLTISDTGTGIASDDLDKIFEPFYTKKKMGRSGTGLGMAVVWGTVKDHNGYIDIQSAEGKGTTFTLHFPVTRKSVEERSEISLKNYMGKGEAILVVDDVEEQRIIASGMLKELGYSVVSVPSGEEAVEYLKINKADLLVLDMIMDPGMDGLDTYKRILEIHPSQKTIIASGFSETDRVKELQSLGAGAYIRKPFLLEKIGPAVKEELEN